MVKKVAAVVRKDHVPLVITFHLAINELRDVFRRLHTMLDASEEHKRGLQGAASCGFQMRTNLKGSLVSAKLP